MEKSKSNYETINAFGNTWASDSLANPGVWVSVVGLLNFLQQHRLSVAKVSEDATEWLHHLAPTAWPMQVNISAVERTPPPK